MLSFADGKFLEIYRLFTAYFAPFCNHSEKCVSAGFAKHAQSATDRFRHQLHGQQKGNTKFYDSKMAIELK